MLKRAANTDEEVIQLRRDGKTIRAIAGILTKSGRSISKSEVDRILKRHDESVSQPRAVPRHGTGEENLTIQDNPRKRRVSRET